MKKRFILLTLFLAGCTYPQATVSTVEASPTLRVLGATPTAELFVDGQDVGPARGYGEGGRALSVPHGTHRVDIRDGAVSLYSGDVYLGADTTKTITLTPGAS